MTSRDEPSREPDSDPDLGPSSGRQRRARRIPLVGPWLERAMRERHLPALLGARSLVLDKLDEVPRRMQKVTDEVTLLLELARDYHNGSYRRLPWYSLATAVVGLLYFVSPTDIVPDFLPIIGVVDDIAVLALVTRLLRRDLRRYCEYKGYPVEKYF